MALRGSLQDALSVPLSWIWKNCLPQMVVQAVFATYPVLLTSLCIRMIVLALPLSQAAYDLISTLLGFWALWWYYEGSVLYFVIILLLVYMLLRVGTVGKRGVIVGGVCMLFVMICELFIVAAAEWHKVRGSFLVVSMKLVSLAYDLDSPLPSSKRRDSSPSSTSSVITPIPSPISFVSFAIFPATTVFGPFVTYSEHLQYTRKAPITVGWFLCIARSLSLSVVTFSFSMCIFPFLFDDPHWNKWFTAYSAAASFRYSHFFVSFLSEATTILSGIGYTVESTGSISWAGFKVVYPLDVELPRSLGSLVTSWNIPMHIFLKNYVFKPVLIRLNYAGAFFFTFLTSAMLHGLNFQLAAVLLSIALYAYAENRFRYRLSKRLDACVKDKPCSSNCSHRYKSTVPWVMWINGLMTCLTIFHLAYLGVMFGGDSPDTEDTSSSLEGYSMLHTLRHWHNLDFLSHYITLATFGLSFII